MTGFHDTTFPLAAALGASGGPVRRTDIAPLANGHEQRNTPHAHSRRLYDAGIGIRSADDVHELIAFFEARRGQLFGFRFRDPLDHKSCPPSAEPSASDQHIGNGDGSAQNFQLIKFYGDTAGSYQRIIRKPVAGTIVVAIDGAPVTAFSADDQSGIITFAAPPASGALITAGFEFDVPVRFDTPHLSAALEGFGGGSAVSVPLIEIVSDA